MTESGIVLYTLRYDVLPQVGADYTAWTVSAMGRAMGVPGLSELRVFQAAAGSPMVVLSFEFATAEAFSKWRFHADVQKVIEELTMYSADLTAELWDPSPMLSRPEVSAGFDLQASAVRYVTRWDLLPQRMDEYSNV